jgi:uncharacterized membrane protein
MDKAILAYAIYMLVFLILAGSALLVPVLAFGQDMGFAYEAFGPTCHQKMSRSLCVFRSDSGYWVADCTPQGGAYVGDYLDRKLVRTEAGSAIGYKMPLCSRDFGIYGAMLLAGAIYPFVRRLGTRAMYPAAYLLLAMVPIALDGGLQLASEIDKPLLGFNVIPFEYESTNAMRLLTGAIAGFAASFYAIPVLVNVFSPGEYVPAARKENAGAGMPAPPSVMSADSPAAPKKARNRRGSSASGQQPPS